MLAGSAVGFLFDIYRSFRSWNKPSFLMTFIGDIFFSLGALILLWYFLDKANDLALRFYILWGSLLGLFIYLRLLSPLILKILYKIHKLLHLLTRGLIYILRIPCRGLILVMHPFYAVLGWIGLLLYRMGEALILPPLLQLNKKIIIILKRIFP
ncbi:MAG: spore cortex biosynthesis protein YabQ [Desulfitobacteriaceae bacterium]|nr:spore cortex biosynthesis protein YabQ [Desulfitobacteriaceae bacterium]